MDEPSTIDPNFCALIFDYLCYEVSTPRTVLLARNLDAPGEPTRYDCSKVSSFCINLGLMLPNFEQSIEFKYFFTLLINTIKKAQRESNG